MSSAALDASAAVQIVFLAYVSRSGSTFLANQLSRHPAVCVCPEAGGALWQLLREPDALTASRPETVSELCAALRRDPKLSAWNLAPERLHVPVSCRAFDVFVRVLDSYRQQSKPASTIIVVKGGSHLIRPFRRIVPAQVPDVKFLFILRDGRAVYASQKASRDSTTGRPMQVSPVAAARTWRRFVLEIETLNHDPRAHVVRYEDLIASTDRTLDGIYAWLAVPPPPAGSSPDFAPRIPQAQAHLHPQVSEPPDATKLGKWRAALSPIEVRLYEDEAGQALRGCGYVPEAVSVPAPVRVAWRVWFQAYYRYHVAARKARRLFVR